MGVQLSERQETFIKEVERLNNLVDRLLETMPIFAAVFRGDSKVVGNNQILPLMREYLALREKVSGDACTEGIVDVPKVMGHYWKLAERFQETSPITQFYYYLLKGGYLQDQHIPMG